MSFEGTPHECGTTHRRPNLTIPSPTACLALSEVLWRRTAFLLLVAGQLIDDRWSLSFNRWSLSFTPQRCNHNRDRVNSQCGIWNEFQNLETIDYLRIFFPQHAASVCDKHLIYLRLETSGRFHFNTHYVVSNSLFAAPSWILAISRGFDRLERWCALSCPWFCERFVFLYCIPSSVLYQTARLGFVYILYVVKVTCLYRAMSRFI